MHGHTYASIHTGGHSLMLSVFHTNMLGACIHTLVPHCVHGHILVFTHLTLTREAEDTAPSQELSGLCRLAPRAATRCDLRLRMATMERQQ